MSTGKPVFELWTERSPAGELRVVSVRGVEQISRPFSFEILALADSVELPALERDLLGQPATLWIRGDSDETSRPIHGIVRRIEAEGISGAGDQRHRFRFWLAPRLWRLGRGRMSRIFQDQTVPEIVTAVLAGADVPCVFRLLRKYAPRRYSVQHQESDLAFVRRLCAEEGIFFWFEHTTDDTDPTSLGLGLLESAARAAVGSQVVAAAEGALRGLGLPVPGALVRREVVVFGDEAQSVPSISGSPDLVFRDSGGMEEMDQDVRRFRRSTRAAVGSTRILEYDFQRPSLDHTATAEVGRGSGLSSLGDMATSALRDIGASALGGAGSSALRDPGQAARDIGQSALRQAGQAARDIGSAALGELQHALSGDAGFEWSRLHDYDHHGEFEGTSADPTAAGRRLEQLRVRAEVAQGESRCRRLLPGKWFTLTGDPLQSLDGRYTVTRVEHEGHAPETRNAESATLEVYKNRFACVPGAVAPRPAPVRRRIQQVMETAVVVGPAGQEIHTDSLGRVKVQFHWDRAGQKNQHSSCWIRTVQAWAGNGWGFQFLPRIGMEVMVVFLAGDTDRPMIVGSVYNAEHPPSFPLPAHKTRSGIRTQSSKGEGHNELSFEDRAGHERVYVRAQRDLETAALRDHTSRVGNNRTEQVTANRYALVGGNDLTSVDGSVTVAVGGDETRAVEGNQSTRVQGDVTEAVTGRVNARIGGDRETRIGGGERRAVAGSDAVQTGDDRTVRVGGCLTTLVGARGAKRSYTLRVEGSTLLSGSGPTVVSSEDEVLLQCGKSFVHITSDRIDIVSPTVSVQASGARLTAGDDKITMKTSSQILGISDDKVAFRGSGAGVTLSSDARVDGSQVHLKSADSGSLSATDESSQPTTIELVDDRGEPIPYQRYVITTSDGARRSGMLDADGKAVLDLEESASITFPGLPTAEEG